MISLELGDKNHGFYTDFKIEFVMKTDFTKIYCASCGLMYYRYIYAKYVKFYLPYTSRQIHRDYLELKLINFCYTSYLSTYSIFLIFLTTNAVLHTPNISSFLLHLLKDSIETCIGSYNYYISAQFILQQKTTVKFTIQPNLQNIIDFFNNFKH